MARFIIPALLILSLLTAFSAQETAVEEVVPPIYEEQVLNATKTWADEQYDRERKLREQAGINYDNIQSYSFGLKYSEEFVVAVEVDQVVKGIVTVYWEESNTYVESQPTQGEEVRLVVYQDRRVVLINEVCYHTMGFNFMARKGHEYLLRFLKDGKDKLIVLHMENYLTQGKTADILNKHHIGQHEQESQTILNKLKTYLSIAQQNAVFNEHISNTVKTQTHNYMIYQVMEMVLVLTATVAQIYFIKKLLANSSVV